MLGVFALVLASVPLSFALAQQPAGGAAVTLEDGFAQPPDSAKPRVWWHWMNGNVTKEGIRKDLEWMKRIGVGGFHAFDAALETPQIVQERLVYMSPAWKEAFRYSATLADRPGLEMGIAASPGWSETGGPWVAPQDAMKKMVWSELVVTGGRRFQGSLPQPPGVAGVFQEIGIPAPPAGEKAKGAPNFYADSLVFAYPLPERPRRAAVPRLLDAAGQPLSNPSSVTDDDFLSGTAIDRGTTTAPAMVIMQYRRPQTIRSAQLYIPDASNIFFGSPLRPTLEASDDGSSWRRVTDIPVTAAPTTQSFKPVTASWFRLVIRALPGSPREPIRIGCLKLSPEPRINSHEIKAGFYQVRDFYALDADVGPDIGGVSPKSVIDLTARYRNGRLDWTPPRGRWKVVRMGYSLTGTMNHPAPPEATGLEVDKYDAAAVRRYIETYLTRYADAAGPNLFGLRGVQALITDSTEVGPSNWTPRILEHFQRLRGYDPRPFLPALVGEIVGSRSQSDAFLYDYRRTLADLMSTEHYGTIAEVARARGLFVYGESLEAGRPVLGDDIEMRRFADIPMAAVWTWRRSERGPNNAYLADAKGASSVAHVYGKALAAAESMTSSQEWWNHSPDDLKRIVDMEFAYGINRIVIHTSVHQPLDDKVPGLSLQGFGQFFNRHETWAEMAKPWIDYIARSSFMLQQGRNVADVAYFYGEEASPTGLFQLSRVSNAPVRYAFDYVGADAVLNLLSVEGGHLVTPGGARYRALYLGGSSRRMTLPVLRKLAALVEAGAWIIGMPPEASPGLQDNAAEFAALVRRMWPGGGSSALGHGRVIATDKVEDGLQAADVPPDFAYQAQAADAEVLFVHRQAAGSDIYFVNNRRNRPEALTAQFRVTGKVPEIWRADTGRRELAPYRMENGVTFVSLDLLPEDALFVVFQKPTTSTSATPVVSVPRQLTELSGAWDVSFQAGRGAPSALRLPALQSLSENADPGVRYFSGVATYRKSFSLPRRPRDGGPLLLDLEKVGDVAEVLVNGKSVGFAWKSPYRVDIGSALRVGPNQLEIRVANLWRNRIIGDLQPGAKKITFTTIDSYKATDRLRPSGLIGPVRIFASDARRQ